MGTLLVVTTPSELPPGYEIEESPRGVTITNRWAGPLPIVGAAIALGCAIRADLTLNDVMGTNPLEGGFFYATRVGAAAIALLFCWLERTIYTVSADYVTVRRRPFFWPGDRTIATADIERLEIVVTKSREHTSAHHALFASLRDGSRPSLIEGFASPGFPRALLEMIERFRGRQGEHRPIEPAPSDGLTRFLPLLALAVVALGFVLPMGPDRGAGADALRRRGADVTLKGGRVVVEFSRDTAVRPDDLAHLRGVARLGEVRLFDAHVDDQTLSRLAGLAGLRRLDLGLNPISDAGLVGLRGLTGLESLDLGGCIGVGDDGLEHLQGLRRLRTLNLASTRVTDAAVAPLARLTALEDLDLRNTSITDAGIQGLRRSLPRTTIIGPSTP